jgi:hypothetical protein
MKMKTKLKSLLNSFVHDSFSSDTYPGELIPMATLFQKIMTQLPGRIHSWASTVPMTIDLEVGRSWGGSCDLKLLGGNSVEIDGNHKNFSQLMNQLLLWDQEIAPQIIELTEYQDKNGKDKAKAILEFPEYRDQ